MSPTKTALDKPAAAKAKPKREIEPKAEERANELSEAWFSMARGGQETSFDIARRLVDIILPLQGGEDSRRRQLIDGAFDLADRAAAAQLGMMRGAVKSAVNVYIDVDVNVDTDVDAFTGVDVGVDVTVPTDVGAFKNRSSD